MKGLKQTLTKEDPKKTKKVNLTATITNKKKTQWNQLSFYKSPTKTFHEPGLDLVLKNIIENSFKSNSIKNIDKIVKDIVQNCIQNEKFQSFFVDKVNFNKTIQDKQLKKLEQIKKLVQEILDKNQSRSQSNDSVIKFYEELTDLIKRKNKKTKKQKLEQYDKLIKILSAKKIKNAPKREKTEEKQQKQRKFNELIQKANNIQFKIVKQEYEIKRGQSPNLSIRRGSQGKIVKSTNRSSHSGFKSDNGNQKLKKFLQKDPSIKVIKTKVQYDYSAIFDASKSKIHTRDHKNMTTDNVKGTGSHTDLTKKLNKAKKNDAFVFYRPKTGHQGYGHHKE